MTVNLLLYESGPGRFSNIFTSNLVFDELNPGFVANGFSLFTIF